MQRFMFTIHQNDKLFTISSIANPLIFASFDKQKVLNLVNILKTHKTNTNKWLNSTRMVTNNFVHLTENEHFFNSNKIEIGYYDLNDKNDLICIANMSHVHNIKIFFVKDFFYDSTLPLLSVQGIIVHDGPIQVDYDNIDINVRSYFEQIIKKK